MPSLVLSFSESFSYCFGDEERDGVREVEKGGVIESGCKATEKRPVD